MTQNLNILHPIQKKGVQKKLKLEKEILVQKMTTYYCQLGLILVWTQSVRNRWSTIQLATNKFCGALAQIERRSPSGVSEQDKIEQAKELYRSKHSATFNFLHCWTILRHHPKWQQFVVEGSSAKTKRRSIIPDDHVPESLDEDTMSPYVDVNLEEHNEKAAEKKREREENASSYLIDLVIEMREERRSANVEKGEDRKELIRLTKEKLELDKERLELDKQREENEIMRIDSSALSPMQQEYFHSLQLEILEKQRSRKS
ncbi:uncharacterized protein LOC133821925 isoform X2 [Humulus lupulus]|uniref:uncharacterized protein LOC133821925 isoform X2 n=1 Tax=Humulus lupulus TaxID=3486 RepID=UPI002B409026|nr:uncharacterized protein LOC133821925 isoform X2 [Humulus lupulus]XP_062110089.1 uncharacterized protein LOC133821925 isoform X2 [Humulus lupulus]XP_062110091.1 uncharacterized protein LOC133821925 isoform X2 [Humulus lupulus]